MKRLFYGCSKRRVVGTCILIMLFSLFNSLFTTYMSNLLNLKTQPELRSAIIGASLLLLVWLSEEFVLDVAMSRGKVLLENALIKSYFSKIYETKPEVLKQNNTGYISGLLRKCMTEQQNAFSLFTDIGVNIVYIGYFAITFVQFQFWIGIVVIVLGFAGNIIRILIRKHIIVEVTKRNIHAASEKDKVFIDCTSNINTAQRLQSKDYFDALLDDVNLKHLRTHTSWQIRDEIAFILGKGLTYVFAPIALLIIYSLQPELLQNSFCLALIATVSIQLPHNARALARFASAYDRFVTAISSLDAIINDESVRMPLCTEKFEKLSIRDMDFTYHENSSESLVIKIPEFDVEAGDFVAITGESGQGKTTLLNLMTGEIETNNVTINGSIVGQRLNCVFVAQDTEMFDLSVRDNLTLGRDVPDSLLYLYLDEVGMGEWIRNQPDRLDTMLGERGVFVSTGQRQRLNLIRGLLCTDRDVYILDEPTSNVDVETETRIIRLIQNVLASKTVVCVTHRKPIIALSNKQYVFRDGTLYAN